MTVITTAIAQQNVFLVGRPPMAEFLGFVTSQMVDGHNADVRALSNLWRSANDHVRQLEAAEAGIANDAAVGGLPPELAALGTRVLADPLYQRVFEVVPTRIGMVELIWRGRSRRIGGARA